MSIIDVLLGSLGQAFLSTLASSLLGLLLAWLLMHAPQGHFKTFFQESLLIFFMIPSITLVLSLLYTGKNFGGTNFYGLAGIVICHTFLNAPFMARSLLYTYQTIPTVFWRESQHLDLGIFLRFRCLEWPFLKIVFLKTAGLILVLCLVSFSIPLMLSKNLHALSLSLALYSELILEADPARAFLYIVPFIILVTFMAYLNHFLIKEVPSPSIRAYLHTKKNFFYSFLLGVFATVLMLPLILGLLSFLSRETLFLLKDATLLEACKNSFLIALTAAGGSSLLALLLVLIMPSKVFPLVQLILSIFLLPSFVIGGFLIIGAGTFFDDYAVLMTLLLHILIPLPFTVQILKSRLTRLQRQNEPLVLMLRLTFVRAIRVIYLPQIKKDLLSVFALSAVFSLGDIGAAALFGGAFETLPSLILGCFRTFDLERGMAFSYILLFSMGLFLLPNLWIRKGRMNAVL
tara:strand:- start:1875 stop:3254 length:1380 start_codon:yes stop_codon:yes gene_type:complete